MNDYSLELKRLREQKGFPDVLAQAQTIIRQSGLLSFLEIKGRVNLKDDKGNIKPPDALAHEASRSAGYMEAIRDIMNFHEIYLKDTVPDQFKVSADFGGTQANVLNGVLS